MSRADICTLSASQPTSFTNNRYLMLRTRGFGPLQYSKRAAVFLAPVCKFIPHAYNIHYKSPNKKHTYRSNMVYVCFFFLLLTVQSLLGKLAARWVSWPRVDVVWLEFMRFRFHLRVHLRPSQSLLPSAHKNIRCTINIF